MPFWMLALASVLPGNADQVRLMKTGDVALVQIHHDLTRARRTIDVSTYIWDPCSTIGKLLLETLRARARAGVRVRVLLDAYVHTPELRRDLAARFTEDGIDFRYFNPRRSYDLMNNRRMHAKLIVVDGERYYLGGRNVADDYFDMGRNNWIDRDVEVEGSSAAAAQADFEKLWNSPLTTTIDRGPGEEYATWEATCLAPTEADRHLARVIASDGEIILGSQPTYACGAVTPVTDDPDFLDAPGRFYLPGLPLRDDQYRRKYATRAVVDFLREAEDLTAENYTYVPDGRVDDAIRDLRTRGVHFDLFTNAVMDQPPLQFLKERSVHQDNYGTQRVFELSTLGSVAMPWAMTPAGPVRWSIHTKTMASGPRGAPRRNGVVGSFNFDPRSYSTNVEAVVVVRDCPDFAADLQASMMRLADFYARDRDCAVCRIKPEISLSDEWQGRFGRPLYEVGGRPPKTLNDW